MDTILKCSKCNLDFNLFNRNPRILPCSQLICCECIEAQVQVLGGYSIKCECSESGIHEVESFDDLYPSQLTLFYLKQKEEQEKLTAEQPPPSPPPFLDSLKNVLEAYKYKLELAKYEINKHYDDIEMDIDIRAETLINFVHEQRDVLHGDIKQCREDTNTQIESFQPEFNKDLNRLESKYNSICSQLKSAGAAATACSNNNNNNDKNLNEIKQFIHEFNNSQRSVDELKKKAWYFAENTAVLDKSLLGSNLSNDFDTNYLKVKNINFLLANDLKRFEITLKPKFNDEKLRQYIVPLSRKKILSCYFTISKRIYLEIFDQNGHSCNLLKAAENVTYFPITLANKDWIILSYISKVKLKSDEVFGETTVSYVSLYDSDLNLIKTITDKSLIESIYMNDSLIVCSFAHKTFECCKIYDLQLNFIESFGQQNDSDKPFFMEKSTLIGRQTFSTREKLNPVVFGMTDTSIYFYNTKTMFVMCRKTGAIMKELEKLNDKSVFTLDSKSNMIETNSQSNKIKLFNFNNEIAIESTYNSNFDDIFLIENNFFGFIDKSKETLLIV